VRALQAGWWQSSITGNRPQAANSAHCAAASSATCTCPAIAAAGESHHDGMMKLEGIPFQSIDWSRIEPTSHPGDPGAAIWRTVEVGNVRVRKVEYTPGYVADHWCERGHVLLVLAGQILTELSDGRQMTLSAGQTYIVADGDGAHRSSSPGGARLFIVD
jgi:hypothetical protein